MWCLAANGSSGASIYRYARVARFVDGADEVHEMVLNRLLAE